VTSGCVHDLRLVDPSGVATDDIAIECVPLGAETFIPPDVGEIGIRRMFWVAGDPFEANRVVDACWCAGSWPQLDYSKVSASQSASGQCFSEKAMLATSRSASPFPS